MFQENIKKFQEEAKKYEQSETLSTRVKVVNKIKVSFENYLGLFYTCYQISDLYVPGNHMQYKTAQYYMKMCNRTRYMYIT